MNWLLVTLFQAITLTFTYNYLLFCMCILPETVNPNRWTTLTKLSASPSPLSDEDDVALITVEMEPGNDYFITTNTISF